MSKYYKHTYTITVLSESDAQDSIDYLAYNVTYGDDCLHGTDHALKEVDGKEMAQLLIEAGSDPEFFNLSPELLKEGETK